MRNAIFLSVLVLVGCGRAIQPQAGVNPSQAPSSPSQQAQTPPVGPSTMSVTLNWQYQQGQSNVHGYLTPAYHPCQATIQIDDSSLLQLERDMIGCQVGASVVTCPAGFCPPGARMNSTCVWAPSYAL
jgi:hypothetical protein